MVFLTLRSGPEAPIKVMIVGYKHGNGQGFIAGIKQSWTQKAVHSHSLRCVVEDHAQGVPASTANPTNAVPHTDPIVSTLPTLWALIDRE